MMLSSGETVVHTPPGDPANGDGQPVSAAEAASAPAAKRSSPLLRRADQVVIAALVAASLVAVAAYWYLRGGASGQLIEIEADGIDTPGAPLKSTYSIDLNTADWPEFEPLPNVGERLARRIVESRESEGPFESVDDLTRIRGIGEKTVERLRPYLRVGGLPQEKERGENRQPSAASE